MAVIQTDSYCSIQQTEQLYRQGKVVSIDDDGGGGAYASIRIYSIFFAGNPEIASGFPWKEETLSVYLVPAVKEETLQVRRVSH